MNVADLPSRTLPQRNMLAPASILADLRAFIDVDVVWDCEGGHWTVLERCPNPKRWATINGRRIEGWREAVRYVDEDGTPFHLDHNIVPFVRSLDYAAYDGRMDKFEDAKYATANRQTARRESDLWERADDAARDKLKTGLGTRGVPKIKKVGDNRPLFGRAERKVYAASGWGQ